MMVLGDFWRFLRFLSKFDVNCGSGLGRIFSRRLLDLCLVLSVCYRVLLISNESDSEGRKVARRED